MLGLDVFMRQGVGIQLAIAGFDRLFLKDSDRQAHIDGSALLLGYLLGLPCFCFQPDVAEALKMLKDNVNSLNAYKQTSRNKKLLVFDKDCKYLANYVTTTVNDNTSLRTDIMSLNNPTTYTDLVSPESKTFSLARVLIWLMAPVAAESLKYG